MTTTTGNTATLVELSSGSYGVKAKDILSGSRVMVDNHEIVVGNIVKKYPDGTVIAAISPATKHYCEIVAGGERNLPRARYIAQANGRFAVVGDNLVPGQRVVVDKRNGSEDIKVVKYLTQRIGSTCVAMV